MDDAAPPEPPADDLSPGRKRRPFKVTCGAWGRQRKAPCANAPSVGRTRCRFHGGKTPRKRTDAAGTSRLYASFATDEEKAAFKDVHAELVKDPAGCLLREAAALKVRIDQALRRMNSDGMIVSERTATKEKYLDRQVLEDGTYSPPKSIREIERMQQRQVDAIEPLSNALIRMAKIINEAAELRRNPPGASGRESALSMNEAAQILISEFSDPGALPQPTGVEAEAEPA